jgi:hypothetical protein
MKNYDDWKTDFPEEEENECDYCGSPCDGEFCDRDCKRAYIADNNDDI